MNTKSKIWLVWLVRLPVLFSLLFILTIGIYSLFVDSADEINTWVVLILPIVLSIYYCRKKIAKIKGQAPGDKLEEKITNIEVQLTDDKLVKEQEQPLSKNDLYEKKLKSAITKSWFTFFPAYYAFFFTPLAAIYAIFADFENITDIWASIVFGLPLLLAISVNRQVISDLKDEEKKRKQKEKKAAKKAIDKERVKLERLEKDKREKQNLVKIKDELKALLVEVNAENGTFLETQRKKYTSITNKVHQEQEAVKDLKNRHPIISDFISSRGTDDTDSKIFKELEEIFQSSSSKY